MNTPVIIPNLYCSWYISGGPSHRTIEIGKPPQIQNGTCPPRHSGISYFSMPVTKCAACSK